MDLRALRYFVETVRHSSFTQAAEHLCVTQSTVSKMVRQLEDEVGQPLLIREGRGVRLTDAGRIVFERGQEALDVVKRLTQDVADLGDLVRGEVTVGIPPMVNLFFPPLIKRFKERYPQIKLMAQEAGGQVIEQRVLAGELEVGVTVLPVPADSGLASTELGRFPICLVGTKASSWYGLPQPTLASLDREPLLMFSEDYALTKRLREGFARAGVSPVVVGQSGQWDFLLSLAMAGRVMEFRQQRDRSRLAKEQSDASLLVEQGTGRERLQVLGGDVQQGLALLEALREQGVIVGTV